jgi:hypothetical protein
MLKIDSKSTDMKDSPIHMPHVYGVVKRGLRIGGCFFIVHTIQVHSRYRAIFPVGPGTASTERIRVSSSLIKTINVDSSQIHFYFNNANCT